MSMQSKMPAEEDVRTALRSVIDLDNARQALAVLLPAGAEIELNLVWEPPWGPDKMGEHARKYFGWG